MGEFNSLFNPGKITILMDGTFGSSGKAKIASAIAAGADNWTFGCNTFAPQAGHWSVLRDGRRYFYQTLNSFAYNPDRYEKLYIGPGSMIELPSLFAEMEKNKVPTHKLGISPCVAILRSEDGAYERGEIDFDGKPLHERGEGTLKKGTTAHGVGACGARKILRRPEALYAKDIPELKEFMCDVPAEITKRLNHGESGFGELAQGYPLSLNHSHFLGYTTSRNVTVSQFLSDMFLPPKYAGPVIINFRTLPIRINSDKFVSRSTGKFLTWAEIEAGEGYDIIKGDSGPWYPDQKELTWNDVTKLSGSKEKIIELTSVTKLPRRVATFSKMCLEDAVQANDAGHGVYVTINFMNYIDDAISGMDGSPDKLTNKCKDWLNESVYPGLGVSGAKLLMLGTGACTEDYISL